MVVMTQCKKLWVLMILQLFLLKEIIIEFIFSTWVKRKPCIYLLLLFRHLGSCKLWVRLFFIKTWIPQIFFKQCFCLLEYYLWWEFRQYWSIGTIAKRAISWMLNRYAKLWKLLSWQPQMLFWWNLPRLCIFIRA